MWLNKEMLSVYDYWQFWRNTEDGDVGKFLRLFTDMPLAEIARLETLQGAELNDAKKILATEATAVLHGRAAAEGAAETARRTFEEGESAAGLPTFDLPLTPEFRRYGIPLHSWPRIAGWHLLQARRGG